MWLAGFQQRSLKAGDAAFAERPAITELQLQAVAGSKAMIPTLQPVKHLLPRLEIFVLDDIAVSLLCELQQLAEAAPAQGWQLQSLVIAMLNWYRARNLHWAEVRSALRHLTTAFSALKQLDLTIPEVECGTIASDHSLHKTCRRYRPLDFDWQTDLARVAVSAAVADAVLQLKDLEELRLAEVPDIWGTESAYDAASLGDQPAQSAVATASATNPQAAAFANVTLQGCSLPSVSAAGEVFGTMDHYGCWLLQQHPTLRQLSITNDETDWEMSWWQQQKQHSSATQAGNTASVSNISTEAHAQCSTRSGAATALAASDIQMSVALALYNYAWAYGQRRGMMSKPSSKGGNRKSPEGQQQ